MSQVTDQKAPPWLSPIQAVVLDLGHTILFPNYQLMADTLAEYRVRADADRLFGQDCQKRLEGNRRAVRGEDTDWFWENYWCDFLGSLGLSGADVREVMIRMGEANERLELWGHILPDTRATLARLRESELPLAVVSNSDGRVEAYLRKNELFQFFDVVIDSHLVGVRKPMPEIFHFATSRLGIEARDCLYVGDVYPIDLLGAWRAGMQAALLSPEEPGEPFAFTGIRRLGEIPDLINQSRGVSVVQFAD